MVGNPGRVLTHRQLLTQVWGARRRKTMNICASMSATCARKSRTILPSHAISRRKSAWAIVSLITFLHYLDYHASSSVSNRFLIALISGCIPGTEHHQCARAFRRTHQPHDLFAIEAALRLKDQHGGRVTVISMGPPQAEPALRKALSFGCDDAVLVTDKAFSARIRWQLPMCWPR